MAKPNDEQKWGAENEERIEKSKPSSDRYPLIVSSELEVLKARQKLALMLGALALVLLLVGGAIAIVLFNRWAEHQKAVSIVQLPTQPSPTVPGSLVQTPIQPPNPPAESIVQTPIQPPNPPAESIVQTPPIPIPPQPISQPQPTFQQPTHPQKPTPSKELLDYLEQLRRIERQRKREAKNYWIALGALNDLLKGLQGFVSTGDPLVDVPSDFDPHKTVQAYEAYKAKFVYLRQWLHQLRPPPECQQLHQAYDYALRTHISTIETLKMKIAAKDLAGVTLYGLGAQGQITNALQTADSHLESICNYYSINKFFTIGD